MEWFDAFYQWFMSLGEQYGVNPIVFGSIYVGAVPFFTLSIAWLIKNYRKGVSIVLPVLSASFLLCLCVFVFNNCRTKCTVVGLRGSCFNVGIRRLVYIHKSKKTD